MARVGQPASLLCGAVCERGVKEGTMLLTWPSPCFPLFHPLLACDWHPSSCCPGGDSQSGWVCISSRTLGALLMDSPWRPAVSSATPTPLVCTTKSYEALFSWCLYPGLCGLASGCNHSLPRCTSRFLFTVRECGTACSAGRTAAATLPPHRDPSNPHSLTPPLLPIWMGISSLNP